MTLRFARRALSVGLFCLVAGSAAAPALAPQLAGLAPIEPGEWQLREAGALAGAAPRSLCVGDPAMLLQLGHPGEHCARLVIADAADGTTVHYTCPRSGHGHTVVSVENPRLIHVKTEGIARGAPFDYDYEGRRVGACAPPR